MSAYFEALRRYFDTQGRSTRSEFWLFVGYMVAIGLVVRTTDSLFRFPPAFEELGGLFALWSIFHMAPYVSVTVRRLHDSGLSSWWMLLVLAPGLSAVLPISFEVLALMAQLGIVILALRPSSPGPNRYGAAFSAIISPEDRFSRDNPFAQPPPQHDAEPPAGAFADPVTHPSGAKTNALDQLERLAALRKSGAIDDVEFALLKSEVLARKEPL